jgi:hypothetical protein
LLLARNSPAPETIADRYPPKFAKGYRATTPSLGLARGTLRLIEEAIETIPQTRAWTHKIETA